MDNTLLWLAAMVYVFVVWKATPKKIEATQFFSGQSSKNSDPAFWLVVASAAITWIFAKSIVNAANLTYAFGIWGGIGYATYYLSFFVAAIAIYFIRVRGGHTSLSGFLIHKYGVFAAKLFLIAIAIRLYNEVWSNTKVVGLFFGDEGSAGYWTAATLFTLFTVAYSHRSGLRGSLLTDGVQMLLAGFLLAVILLAIFPTVSGQWPQVSPAESAAGVTFVFLALTQVLSYPFHDPVLTDRAFLLSPKRMLKAFVIAGVIAGGFILLFGLVGMHGRAVGFEGQNVTMSVATSLGLPLLLVFNVLMLTSAGSTLDSTFASTAKLSAKDWKENKDDNSAVLTGRKAIIWIAVLGNLPLLSVYFGDSIGPAVIKATTISGTMVMGLAPIFLLSFLPARRSSFHLTFWPGILFGVLLAFMPEVFPESWQMGEGKYALSLGVNIYGLLICTFGYIVGCGFNKKP